MQADFAKHVDVLGFRDGRLALLWQRLIELDISNPQTILNVVSDPVADVDGDKKLEVLINTYNVSGDHRWHLTVHDGITGIVKADLMDECLQSLVDLDGDGICELLTIRAEQGWIPARGTIQVHSMKRGKHQVLWQRENAAWEDCHSPPPLKVNSAAIHPDRDALHRRVHNQMCS